jgi:hypothetical protein
VANVRCFCLPPEVVRENLTMIAHLLYCEDFQEADASYTHMRHLIEYSCP